MDTSGLRSGTSDREPVDEEEWLDRARGGDREAFRRIVETYRNRAYGLALRIVGSEPDAEEAAQDAFVRVWRALPQFRGESKFSTWLYRVVVRCAYDASARIRARRGRETPLDDAADPGAAAAAGMPSVAVDPEAGARERRVARLLESLTEVQRAAVTLYYFEDRSVEEVARALDLPEGTVKTHLHRARRAAPGLAARRAAGGGRHGMNCGALERWLDDGMPVAGSRRAHAHAARCPICAGRLEQALALEAFLEFAAPPPAPPDFATRAMARIALEASPAPRVPATSRAEAVARPARPAAGWVGVLAEPAFTASVAVASALLASWKAAQVVARALPELPGAALLGPLRVPWPRVTLGLSPLGEWMLLLSLLPLVAWGSLVLSRRIEETVRPRTRRG